MAPRTGYSIAMVAHIAPNSVRAEAQPAVPSCACAMISSSGLVATAITKPMTTSHCFSR